MKVYILFNDQLHVAGVVGIFSTAEKAVEAGLSEAKLDLEYQKEFNIPVLGWTPELWFERNYRTVPITVDNWRS